MRTRAENWENAGRCYRDMGIPAFWAFPFPKTLVIWASPSHLILAIMVRVTGDAHITRVLGMGIPTSL